MSLYGLLTGRRSFGGVTVSRKRISQGRHRQNLLGVTASVDSAGQIRQAVTTGRSLALGPLSLLFRKTIDDRQLYLIIEGPAFQWVIDVDPAKQKEARQFAARVTTAARKQPQPVPVGHPGAALAIGYPGTPAGWYNDGSGSTRYWDGTQWTGHTS